MAVLPAFFCTIVFIAARSAPVQDVCPQLDAIYREYLARPGIGVLVTLDGRIRHLLEEPWKRDRRSIDRVNYRRAWSEIGINIGKYSEALEYSGKLLVEAHGMNPRSEFRQFTLFAAVMGERPSHGLGEMPDVDTARQYLKEFPQGPFAHDVAIILGDFYSDLYKVIKDVQQRRPRDYKYDCFEEYVGKSGLAAHAERARRLSASYYTKALAKAPAGWKETVDVRHRQSVMEGGDSKSIEAAGWHFCAD